MTASAERIAWAEALADHRAYLIRFARRRVRDAERVEDLVQETLLAAWQGAGDFEHLASPRTWLTGILLRRIADSFRSQGRRPPSIADVAPRSDDVDGDAFDASAAHAAEPIDWIDPQRRLESRQALAALDERLAALPATAARLIALRAFDGLSHREAAQELGLTPRDAAVLLHRTRSRLRAGVLEPATGARRVSAETRSERHPR